MTLRITLHAKKRMRQRLGLPARALERHVGKVSQSGVPAFRRNRAALLHNGYAYIIGDNAELITVYEDRGPTG